MNPYTASALITGGATLGASGINAGLGFLASSLQHDRNKELMELENKYNLMQWHRENEYNLPVNQVQRLKAAGLNPALMYGNGVDGLTAASGNGVSGQSAGMPNLGQIDPLSAAQIERLNAESESIRAQTERENQKQPMLLQNLVASFDKVKNEVENVKETLNTIKLDNEKRDFENNVLSASVDYYISLNRNNALLTEFQAHSYYEGFYANIGLLKSQKSYYDSMSKLNDEQAKQVAFMLSMSKYLWNIEKKYVKANIHNDYIQRFYEARNIRQMNEWWNENKSADWWIGHINEALHNLMNGATSAMMMRGKSSTARGVYGTGFNIAH